LMRTTINLPDDLHRAAQALAHDRHQSLSRTVEELMRRGLRACGWVAGAVSGREHILIGHLFFAFDRFGSSGPAWARERFELAD